MTKARIAAAALAAMTALAIGCGAPREDPTPKNTVHINPTTAAPAKAAPATTSPASAEMANAMESAQGYLALGHGFSRKGLIEQLKYEGYPTKTATTAVDALNTDWNEQAANTAKSYLSGQSFSKKSLTEQLVYEGFTKAQATYGVAKAGL